jgi:hypothetical protein
MLLNKAPDGANFSCELRELSVFCLAESMKCDLGPI